jgi:predicted dehydrogenase
VNMIRGHFGGFKRPRNDSGVMFADGIHFVDLFNFILGALPKSVLAIHHDFMGRGMDDVSLRLAGIRHAARARPGPRWRTIISSPENSARSSSAATS